jgi:nicotinate-nucleotide adenylyltransferase
MRLGIFGGSFDPVHLGHLLAAECCREQAGLDRVVFVPAAVPPHKQERQLAGAAHRVDMLRLAVGGHDAFTVSTDEIDRGGVSYTVDTLARLAATHPGDQLLLILGPDAIREFPSWRDPEGILALAEPLVVEAEGIDGLAALEREEPLRATIGRERLARMLAHRVRMPAIGIRASGLRAAVAAGRSIRYRTPPAVEHYIRAHGLYRPA